MLPETMRTLEQFRGGKASVGVKPLLNFSGTPFESPIRNEYTLAKSMFLEFFRGAESKEVDVEGLQLLINFSAGEEKLGETGRKVIYMRVYRLVTKRSGQKVPRVEIEEIGPRCDFRIGRIREADDGAWKEAMRKGRGTEAKVKKNVETDIVGDKMGKIHLGRQDLGELQTRKMKGLKRGREVDKVDGEVDEDILSFSEGEEEESKRQRIA